MLIQVLMKLVYILPISSDDPGIVEEGFTVLEDWAGNNLLDKTEIDKEEELCWKNPGLAKGHRKECFASISRNFLMAPSMQSVYRSVKILF